MKWSVQVLWFSLSDVSQQFRPSKQKNLCQQGIKYCYIRLIWLYATINYGGLFQVLQKKLNKSTQNVSFREFRNFEADVGSILSSS